MVKIIIVDDHNLVIEGLKIVLSSLDYVAIESTFSIGKELLEYENLANVDVIFLDVFLPDSNGIDLCRKITEKYPSVKIIAISSQAECGIIKQVIKNGANGYMLKSACLDDFDHVLRRIHSNQKLYCRDVKILMEKISIYENYKTLNITRREKEVISLLKNGKSSQEISDELFLSHLTVQTHRRNLLNKFEVRNVIELLNKINEHGLI